MSGKFNNDEQSENIPIIFVAFEISHLDISDKVFRDEHPLNI